MNRIDPQSWKADLPEFREKTTAFYAGDLDKMAYKGLLRPTLKLPPQRGGKSDSAPRLRTAAGRVTREKLAFVAEAVRTHTRIPKIHFTTCTDHPAS